MTSTSRTAQFNRLFQVLKKQSYKPVLPDPDRAVLEHLLFAACLENAHYDVAEQAFAALVHNFFDWNEVRVSTVRELSEVMAGLPDPAAAANRLKRALQSVFETTYSFDLEELRKQNLGPAVERLKKLDGVAPFGIAYVVQSALGGHAIPVDAGVLQVLSIVGLVTDENVLAGEVPGLERAIAKNKGIEFGSLLHQLGADVIANPYSPAVHAVLLEIDPDVRDRLPKRRARRRPEGAALRHGEPKPKEAADAEPGQKPSTAPTAAEKKSSGRKKKAAGEKQSTRKKKQAPKPALPDKEPSDPPDVAEAKTAEAEAEGSPPADAKPAAPKKKPVAAKKTATPKNDPAEKAAGDDTPKKPSATTGLSKKKPR